MGLERVSFRSLYSRVACLFAALFVVAASASSGAQKPGKGEPYMWSEPLGYVWLSLRTDLDPDVAPEEGSGYLFGRIDNPYMTLRDWSLDEYRIPLSTPVTASYPTAYSVPVFNPDGYLAQSLPTTGHPLIDTGTAPTAIKLPQGITDVTGVGMFPAVESVGVVDDADGDDCDAAVLAWTKGPIVLAEDVSIDLNTSTAQVLYDPPSGYRLIVCDVLFHSRSGAVTLAVGTVGFNATVYDDFADNVDFSSYLDHADAVYPAEKQLRQKRGGDGAALYLKMTTLEGSALTAKADVIGYLKKV